LALLLTLAAPQAGKVDPARLAARDSHQGILIACDPYTDAARAKKAMGKENPLRAGFLPVDVYVRNGNPWPVAIRLGAIRLEVVPPGGERQQIDSLSADAVATAMLHPGATKPEARRLPIPFPRIRHDNKWRKLRDKLASVAFPDAVIAPGATVHGFFYFNLGGDFSVVPYARLYVPDLKFLGHEQTILFFDVPFTPAATR
jgi:hypothetical protein